MPAWQTSKVQKTDLPWENGVLKEQHDKLGPFTGTMLGLSEQKEMIHL